jgi:methionyl aminopeptidase
MSVEIKSQREIDAIRVSSQMAAETLLLVGRALRVGMTTDEINTIVHEDTIRRGAVPSPLNYHGYPKSVCTSINNVVCHGIPGAQVLRQGDIINVDVTTYFGGMHGDTSATFYIGDPSDDAFRVTEIARTSLDLAIAEVREGARLGDIGAAIQEYAEAKGCSVVRDFIGHGIGRRFHEPPHVAHFGKRGTGVRLKAGMVFTIEPMINVGDYQVEVLADKWTAITRDGSLSAQFEHTIAVTKTGCEILTARHAPLVNSEVRADGSPIRAQGIAAHDLAPGKGQPALAGASEP